MALPIPREPAHCLCPQVFEFGYNNRTTEFTNLNEHSSRSHALLIVTVRGVDCSTGLRTTGERCTVAILVKPSISIFGAALTHPLLCLQGS